MTPIDPNSCEPYPDFVTEAVKCGPLPKLRDTSEIPNNDLTDGEKVIAWAEACLIVPEGNLVGQPLKLDIYQKAFIVAVFDNPDGTNLAILSIARRNGKALALNTPIATPDGMVPMGDLRDGDFVMGSDGKPTRVVHAHPVMIGQPCYRVTFSDGTSIIADRDHQWTVSSGRTLTTGDMVNEGLRVPRTDGRVENQWKIRSVAGVTEFNNSSEREIEPYVLGLWLAEGTVGTSQLHFGEKDHAQLVSQFDTYGDVQFDAIEDGCGRVRVRGGFWHDPDSLRLRLKRAGVLQDKHIPYEYLYAPAADRWELLRGIFDGDGHVNEKGQADMVFRERRFAEDIALLLRSLGVRVSEPRPKIASISGRVVGTYWRLNFYPYDDQPISTLERHLSRRRKRPANNRGLTVSVVSIEPVDSVPVRCLTVAAEDSLYLAGRGLTPTHNTFVIAVILLALIVGPLKELNTTICSAAQSRDQAAAAFELMVKMLDLSPKCDGHYKYTESSKSIRGLKMNVQYRAISSDAKTGHGKAYKIILLDEAGQIKEETNAFVEMLETSQSNYDDSKLFIISTQAPSDTAYFSQQIDNAERTQDCNMICHVYASDEGCNLLDEKQWAKSNPGLGAIRSVKEMKQRAEKAHVLPSAANGIMNLNFNMRVSSQAVFMSPVVWKNCLEPINEISRRKHPIHIGLDLSLRTDLTAAVASWKDDNDHINVECHAFAPLIGVDQRELRDKAPYQKWAKSGVLNLTPGSTVDYEWVCNFLYNRYKKCTVQTVQFDRWRIKDFEAASKRTKFYALVAEFVEVGQGYVSMSPRLESFEAEALNQTLRTGNHPLLNMAASQAIAVQDDAGSRKLAKSKSVQRIDPLQAAVMAVYPNSDGAAAENPFDVDAMIG